MSALQIDRLNRSFGSLVVTDDISLDIAAGERHVNLVEGERRAAKVSVPLERAPPRRRVELFNAAPDEVDLLHLLKLLAHVHGVVEHLSRDAAGRG